MNRITLASAIVLACCMSASAQQWSDPESVLLSDPKARAQAINQLKLGPGEWHVAVMTMTPGSDSERLLKSLKDNPRAVILVAAPRGVVNRWKARVLPKARCRVVAVPSQLTYDLGVYYLPTVMRVREGRVVAARKTW